MTWWSFVVALAGFFYLASGQPLKTLIRIGVLYDTTNEYLADGVMQEIDGYVARYEISATVQTVALKFDYDSTEPGALIESNLSAIFVSSSSFNCSRYEYLLQRIPMFYIADSPHSCDSNISNNRVIYMFPSHSEVNSAMLNAMLRYSWTSATVLYQSNDEIQYSFQDMQDAGALGIDVSAYEVVGSDDDIQQKLIAARRKGYRTYLFVCSYTRLVKIMKIARQLRLSTSNNHWLIPNVMVNPHSLDDFIKDGVKITSLHSPLVTSLTLKILHDNSSLSQDAHGLYKSVIMALSRIAMRAVVNTCDKTRGRHNDGADGECLSELTVDEVTYVFCGPDSIVPSVTLNGTDESQSTYDSQTDSTTTDSDQTNAAKRVVFEQTCINHEINDSDVPSTMNTSSSNASIANIRSRRKRSVPDVNSDIQNMSPDAQSYTTNTSVTHPAISKVSGRANSQSAEGDDELFITAIFDPCDYSSIYRWQYQNQSCSETFFTSLSPIDSNAIFVIEHFDSAGPNSDYQELLAVGGYNGRRGELSVAYPTFKSSRVELPDRDLDICVIWNPPWLSWEYDPVTREPVPNSFEGFLYDMLLELAISMKFNYVMSNDSAVEFSENFNQTTEEMESRMNELFDSDKCDIFLAAKRIHGGRLMSDDGMGLSKGFQQPRMYLLTKRIERNENVSIWQFLTPFKEESWVVLYVSLFAVSLYMTFINKKNPNEFRRAARELREGAKHSEHMGIMNSLWFNYAVLVQQGSQILPKSISLKVVSGTWWFFVLLVVSAYTANMISFMTQADNEGITTVEELVSQQEFDYGMVETNPLLSKLLPQARNAPYSTMWEQLKRKYDSSIFPNIETGLQRVVADNLILIATFQETVQSILESCDYDKVGDGFYEYQYGLPVPRGWQYLTVLNDHINLIYDKGILTDLEQKWFGDIEAACEKKDEGSTVAGQLDLKAFIGMYVFLSLGVTGGIIVCVYETVYVKYGGFGGLTGRAKKYEFRRDNIEHQRPDKMMKKEFENWPGGWEVIKHRPFVSTISDMINSSRRDGSASVATGRAASSVMLITPRFQGEVGDGSCCPGCGRDRVS